MCGPRIAAECSYWSLVDGQGRQGRPPLAQLTGAIATSQALAEDVRKDVLDGIQVLLEQAKAPPAERKRIVFKPIIDTIANICGGAGGLFTVWQVAGPAIGAFFGIPV